MKVNKCKTTVDYTPYGYEVDYCNLDEEYDLSKIPSTVEEIWYWYKSGSWEGMGQMILKDANGYYLWDLGHCSCYGPLDDIEEGLSNPYKTLEELKAACSEDLLNQLPIME